MYSPFRVKQFCDEDAAKPAQPPGNGDALVWSVDALPRPGDGDGDGDNDDDDDGDGDGDGDDDGDGDGDGDAIMVMVVRESSNLSILQGRRRRRQQGRGAIIACLFLCHSLADFTVLAYLFPS